METITSKLKKDYVKNKGKKSALYKSKTFKALITLDWMFIKTTKNN